MCVNIRALIPQKLIYVAVQEGVVLIVLEVILVFLGVVLVVLEVVLGAHKRWDPKRWTLQFSH